MLGQVTQVTASLSGPSAYLWLLFGIVMSLIVPLARNILKPSSREKDQLQTLGKRGWLVDLAARYGRVGLAAAVIAVFFAIQFDFDTTRLAFLTGYAWDSTLQKVVQP